MIEISTLVREDASVLPRMTMDRGRGAFIVLEGLDRSGKTTQTAKLVDKIEKLGRPCKLIKFPGTLFSEWTLSDRSNDGNWEDD